MNEYHFASVYDVLMEDVPYNKWLDYTNNHLKPKGRILDLGCGTGSFTLLLAESGYHVDGVDISKDMLTIADEKMRRAQFNISLICQDMRQLEGFKDLDGITLFCDGLNYLPNESDVKMTFEKVFKALKPGGVFLFDVHTPYKIEYIFSDQLYGENREDISYLWFCHPGEVSLSVEHTLTFFLKNHDGLYTRLDEEHYQRTFPPEQYKAWLKQAGFDQIEVTSDFGNAPLREDDDRCFFKAVKK